MKFVCPEHNYVSHRPCPRPECETKRAARFKLRLRQIQEEKKQYARLAELRRIHEMENREQQRRKWALQRKHARAELRARVEPLIEAIARSGQRTIPKNLKESARAYYREFIAPKVAAAATRAQRKWEALHASTWCGELYCGPALIENLDNEQLREEFGDDGERLDVWGW